MLTVRERNGVRYPEEIEYNGEKYILEGLFWLRYIPEQEYLMKHPRD